MKAAVKSVAVVLSRRCIDWHAMCTAQS